MTKELEEMARAVAREEIARKRASQRTEYGRYCVRTVEVEGVGVEVGEVYGRNVVCVSLEGPALQSALAEPPGAIVCANWSALTLDAARELRDHLVRVLGPP